MKGNMMLESDNSSRLWFKRAMKAETNQATLRQLLAEAREIINGEAEISGDSPPWITGFLQRSQKALDEIPEDI